ncbi:hypothetical protein F4809DRAFT_615362 [Biscogniauxia mediterranea]|nr:hypothetical protein F4809DRAFT_615362 [Biscogniauxia mediterranea]
MSSQQLSWLTWPAPLSLRGCRVWAFVVVSYSSSSQVRIFCVVLGWAEFQIEPLGLLNFFLIFFFLSSFTFTFCSPSLSLGGS